MIGSSPAAFPGAPSSSTNHLRNDAIRRGSLRDITTVSFGNPNTLPGPAPSHFFPSVPKAKRDQQRAARLSSPPPPMPSIPSRYSVTGVGPLSTPHEAHPSPPREAVVGSPSATSNESESESEQRQRTAKYALAAHGPFPSSSSSSSPFPTRSNPSSLREGSSTSATPTLKSVGGGGSHGTKRRHREAAERTNWDAASELMRFEREREQVIDQWGHNVDASAKGGVTGMGRRRELSARGQQMGSPPLHGTNVGDEAGNRMSFRDSFAGSGTASPRDVDMEDAEGEGEGEDDEFDDDDGASIATFKTGASTKSKGKGKSSAVETEPAKKRSRTLTTPAQTAVLNALLAKTRFPSTETREEVGAQIGMSARRVQIWFQNRRQSQKRLRDREVQDSVISSMPTNTSTHSLPLGHGVPVHPHYPYGPPTSDPYAAHRYPQHGQIPQFQQQQRFGGPHPSQMAASSQHSLHLAQNRADLSRQTSIDSLASRNSFVSAVSGAPPNSHSRRPDDGLGGLAGDALHAHLQAQGLQSRPTYPASRSGPPPTTYQPHPSTTQQGGQFPSKLYFPHVSRDQQGAPSGRFRTESTASRGSTASEVKLPSLSALLNGPSQQYPQRTDQAPPPHRQQPTQVPGQAPYPTSSQPSTATNPPVFNRSIFSPPPSTSFERLRISGGPGSPTPHPEQVPTTSTSPFAFHPPPLQAHSGQPQPPPAAMPKSPIREASPDVLDVAMDTMAYRPAGRSLPPRSTLPPLRSVFGESTFPTKARSGSKTEADKALMAPIAGPSSTLSPIKDGPSNSGPPRLAPISTLPLLMPSSESHSPDSRSGPLPPFSPPVFLSTATRASVLSESSTTHQSRSSMASFEFRHPPSGSSRDRYQQQQQHNGAGWPSIVVGGIASSTGSSGSMSNGGGSSGSPRHRSSVGSSSRTSISSERHEK
ncbi:hypothetical protein JCM16303_002358 [Sporobolomyces ruberrimus]